MQWCEECQSRHTAEFGREFHGRILMTEHTKPVKTPSNWGPDGMSKGKQTGPVRPTPDACQPKKP